MSLTPPNWFSWPSQNGRQTKWHHRHPHWALTDEHTLCGRRAMTRGNAMDPTTDLHPDQACSMCLKVLHSRNRIET